MVRDLTNHLERHNIISQKSVELAIGKALLEEEFRNLLFANPEEALSGFNLTAVEMERLKQVDFETLEFLAQTLCRCNPPVERSSAIKRKSRETHIHPCRKGEPRKAGEK